MSGGSRRYEIVPPGTEDNDSRLYALRDTRTGKLLVDDKGTLNAFSTLDSALEFRHRLSCYQDAGYGRP